MKLLQLSLPLFFFIKQTHLLTLNYIKVQETESFHKIKDPFDLFSASVEKSFDL